MNKTFQQHALIQNLKDHPQRAKDMKLLANAYFDNLDRGNCEYGGWGLNNKRPFGSSFVERDIAKILGWDEDEFIDDNGDMIPEKEAYLHKLYDDLGPYLQIKWFKLK